MIQQFCDQKEQRLNFFFPLGKLKKKNKFKKKKEKETKKQEDRTNEMDINMRLSKSCEIVPSTY